MTFQANLISGEITMRNFSDAAGRSWVLNLTVGCMRRVRAAIGVDLTAPEASVDELGQPAEGSVTLGQRVAGSVMLFVDVLFASVSDQAKTSGVSVDQFCQDLPPDLCRAARLAFLEEWQDFFRRLGRDDQAAIVRGATDLENELRTQRQAASQRLMAAGIQQLKTQMPAEVDKAIAELMEPLESSLQAAPSGLKPELQQTSGPSSLQAAPSGLKPELQQTSGPSSTNSPESSASILTV